MEMTDEELQALEGRPYSRENARQLIYGARIDSNGIIVKVFTSKEAKLKRSFFHIF
jgi:hypothetical protein